jgi:predicted metal-dependent hydrolase
MFPLSKMYGGRSRAHGAPHGPRAVAVSGRTLPLEIREHPRATRMTLRIEPGGKALKLTVPRGLPSVEIDAFMTRQEGWLRSRLAGYPQPGGMVDGAVLAVRGVEHRIVRSGSLRGLTRIAMVDGSAVLSVAGAPQHLGRRISDFLKKEARIDLDEAVARHTATIGRKARSVKLKDTRSRWGSCSTDGNLSFSWRIVMAPPLVIDYLAAHEVAHLVEMNHGPRFWALCQKLAPRTAEAKAWLKQNGNRLQAVDFS